MMMPSIFGENLFDDFMNDFPFEKHFFSERNPLYGKHAKNIMKTDVKETDNSYELDIDLPGFKKEDINVQLDNGYLTITAEKKETNNENDPKHKYIRKERFVGKTSRSFYVGDIDQKEISAKLENGTLVVNVPKEHKNEEKKHIEIQ